MKLICVLSIAFVLGATPAFADDPPYEPKHVPQCTLYKTVDEQEVCGYTLAEWKLVLKIDAELVTAKIRLKKERERTAILVQQVTALLDQARVYLNSQEILTARENKLTDDLIDKDRKLQFERAKPRLGSPVAWSIAGVSVSVLAGVLLKDLLD